MPSFQRSIDHGHHVIELHAWRSPEGTAFATSIYEKAAERLLRHFIGADENEVTRQSLVWREELERSRAVRDIITQNASKVAEAIGVSTETLTGWTEGDGEPTSEQADAILEFLQKGLR